MGRGASRAGNLTSLQAALLQYLTVDPEKHDLAWCVPVLYVESNLSEIGRAAVALLRQHGSRVTADRQELEGSSARRGGTSTGACQAPPPAVARPHFQVKLTTLNTFEWRGRAIWTATTAPAETGLTLTGKSRLDLSPRHSRTLWSRPSRGKALSDIRQQVPQAGQRFAAVWDPSAVSFRTTPNILSAIKQGNRRVVLPGTISGGGDVLRPAGVSRTGLRFTRTRPSQPGIQHLSAGALQTLSGAAGVDTKTGAAIHATVAPGESE